MSKNTEAKKAAVLGSKKSNTPIIITLVVAVALAAGGAYFLMGGQDTGQVKAKAVTAKADVKEFVYPVSYFDDGKARFYSYTTADGIDIRYFILKSSDGVIRAAFDACDSCWSAGKGYKQDGDLMVCNNCGLTFASVKVNEVKGGCNPSPLTRTVVGDKVVIKVNDIVNQGLPYFDLG
jgi:uncharacterized membrane protein